MALLIIPVLVILIFPIMMLVRNEMVSKFRIKLIQAVFEGGEIERKLAAYKKTSYREMLFKFWKPLKLECWFTPEECELLNYN